MAKFKQWSGYSEAVYHAKILQADVTSAIRLATASMRSSMPSAASPHGPLRACRGHGRNVLLRYAFHTARSGRRSSNGT